MSNASLKPPSAPQKKGMHGCLIALLVVCGLFFLLALVGVIAMIRYARTDEGRKVFAAAGKVSGAALRGMNAPGTKELRAAGCPQAFVMDIGEMSDALAPFADGGDGVEELMVMCQGTFAGTLPPCDKVAKTYIGAVGAAAKPFIVIVQTQGSSTSECRERYSASGEDLGPMTETKKHH